MKIDCKIRLITGLLFIASLFLLSPAVAADPVQIVVAPAPGPWIIAVLLAIALFVCLGMIFRMMKKSIGEQVNLLTSTRKTVEDSYAAKIRNEYQAKQALLDKKIEQVKQRFTMVMVKVKSLLETLDPEGLFKAICDIMENYVGANRYILFLYDSEKEELYPIRWQGYSEKIREVLFIPANYAHLITYSIKCQQTIFRGAAINDVQIRNLVDRKPLTDTLVAIPLVAQGKIYGVIHLESFADGHTELDENELKFLSTLSTFIGGALANADVMVQTREELTSAKQLSENEVAEKKRLQDIFSRYASPELIDNLLKNPEKIDLGGVNKHAAVLFTDITGFTAFSSKYSPREIVLLMNEYLSRMTEIIMDNQGEIDKFIGDAIMARFGVLSDIPYPSRSAVEAACAMLVEMDKLRDEWAARGLENFNMRVGIATGQVLAGNIGSKRRQEFTVMGSTVNLASRLEALNKELGTRLLIDEETFKHLPKGIRFNKKENIMIRGLDHPINIYEIQELTGGSKIVSLQSKLNRNAEKTEVPDSSSPALPDIDQKRLD